MFSAGGARVAQVARLDIEQLLRVRVGVDRRHLALDEAEVVDQHLHDRREAVRRAGGVREHVLGRRVVRVGIDARGRASRLRSSRAREMTTFFTVSWMCARARLPSVKKPVPSMTIWTPACAPRDLRRLALGGDGDRLAIDDQAALGDFDRAREAAVGAVVLEQVRVGLVVDEVVDRDDFQLVAVPLLDRLEDLPSDAAEAVDADARHHCP